MESGTLIELDKYLNPGVAGVVFHNYSIRFLKVLKEINILTFNELKSAFELVQVRKLPASKRQRDVVQGHYTYYMNELKRAEERFGKLTDQQRQDAEKEDYLIIE